MKYKLIIFDFDGTLIDTNDIIKESLNKASLEFRKKSITSEEYEKILGKPLIKQMMDLDEKLYAEMDAYYRVYYRTHEASRTALFEGVHELLEQLNKMGIICAILTNKGRKGLDKNLERYDIKKYFSATLSADDVKDAKPNPEGIYSICSSLNIELNRALMVGDSAHDIEAGKSAGIDTALVSWTILDMKMLEELNPNHIICQPEDLLKIII